MRGGWLVVIGLVLGVLGFVFQSLALYALAAGTLSSGVWRSRRARHVAGTRRDR